MKSWIKALPALMLLTGALTASAGEKPDSVTVIKNPQKVVISHKNGDTKVVIYESQADPEVNMPFGGDRDEKRHFGRFKRSHVLFFNGLFGGMVFPTDAPEGMLTSWELGVTHLLGYGYRLSRNGPELGAGLGFAYRWFNAGNGYGLHREGDRMTLTPLPSGENALNSPNSRMTTSSLLLSFSLKQKIYRKFAFMATAILDFNFYTDAFFEYNDGSDQAVKTKVNYKGFHQRVMRCDLMATLGFSGIAGVYVRYAPTPLFKGDYGPRFEQWAVGISMFF